MLSTTTSRKTNLLGNPLTQINAHHINQKNQHKKLQENTEETYIQHIRSIKDLQCNTSLTVDTIRAYKSLAATLTQKIQGIAAV